MSIYTLRRCLLSAFLFSLLGTTVSAKTVSDSLVENLSCQGLNTDKIMAHIRPGVFNSANHLPFKNWAFKKSGIELAACWGMASTQRKFFYLLRLNEPVAPALDIKETLNTIRGAKLEYPLMASQPENPDLEIQQMLESKITDYKVILLAEDKALKMFANLDNLSFLDKLTKGIYDKQGPFTIFRNFRTEVERSQVRHFFRPGNIGMGIGSGPRSPGENAMTLARLKKNISQNRLSLINLRLHNTSQHIVIPKSYTTDKNGNVWFNAYDSNAPQADQPFYYDKKTGHFFAPRIMGKYIGDSSGTVYRPLGVYIVDEEEREQIEESLLKHYKKLCAR